MTHLNPKDCYIVIMAGGSGLRFWPVSRLKTPKQLITLLGNESFLQQTVRRVSSLLPPENLFVITNREQASLVRQQLPGIPSENVVAEPCGRDTCAAVALGAALVGSRNPQGVMAVLPADHVIPNEKAFQTVLTDALAWAHTSDALVTIGIQPTEPATGYGYIQKGDRLTPPESSPSSKSRFFNALSFVEKPAKEVAEGYLASGNYCWNAGMFIWSFPSIQKALQTHCPDMAEHLKQWLPVANSKDLDGILDRQYPEVRKISIDFALMQVATQVVVADGSFDWDDLGAWTALPRHLKADDQGNCGVGTYVQVDSSNNIIFDARGTDASPIALVGVQDTIVVATHDALLIASKLQAQKIKDLVEILKKQPQFKHLL